MMKSVDMVHISRGPIVECVHRGHLAVVRADGRLAHALGDPDYVTFARSSAKLLQAVPVVASGAADRFGLTEPELALLCASHSGEETHVEAVYRILEKIGAAEADLQCGAHAPYHKPSAAAIRSSGASPTAVHNNCSGKHSGMLALAKQLGAPIDGYKRPEHPVQREMLRTFAAFAGVAPESVALGTDGCGVPVYGLRLSSLAAAYARFGSPRGLDGANAAAAERLRDAIAAHPEMLAGSDRFDTALIRATNGRLIGKMGAEGVFAVAYPSEGLGLAVKIEDGAQRALYPAVAEALRQLAWIDEAESAVLDAYRIPAVRNWSGDVVGETIPVLRFG
ncbi:asparaginase [Paenibacillus sp. TRM 82003]|nr:asparaginase [Paenibacillus sp. TRM 82003]